MGPSDQGFSTLALLTLGPENSMSCASWHVSRHPVLRPLDARSIHSKKAPDIARCPDIARTIEKNCPRLRTTGLDPTSSSKFVVVVCELFTLGSGTEAPGPVVSEGLPEFSTSLWHRERENWPRVSASDIQDLNTI